jgi:RNA polymerase sigma factor (sigma-70 family)
MPWSKAHSHVPGWHSSAAMGHFGRAIRLPCMSDITAMDGAMVETTVRSASRGDETAFARLVTQHHASMVRVAWTIADDPDTALDAVQSAWGIAWRELHRLREPERVGTWLVAIAANEAREAMRRRRRRTLTEIPIDPERDDASGGRDPDDSIAGVDLDRALRRLSPDERRLLALRYVAGYDSGDIGRLTGTSASGVRSRLSRLLERLRKDLEHV